MRAHTTQSIKQRFIQIMDTFKKVVPSRVVESDRGNTLFNNSRATTVFYFVGKRGASLRLSRSKPRNTGDQPRIAA